jgi:hypothetical protein
LLIIQTDTPSENDDASLSLLGGPPTVGHRISGAIHSSNQHYNIHHISLVGTASNLKAEVRWTARKPYDANGGREDAKDILSFLGEEII